MKQWLLARKRRRNQQRIEEWRGKVLHTLLFKLLAPGMPFFVNAHMSFLQRDGEAIVRPIILGIFLPEVPLAIDILGPESSSVYRESVEYIDREWWECWQEDLAHKRSVLSRHSIPYLAVDYEQAVDSTSLRDRIRTLTGIDLSV